MKCLNCGKERPKFRKKWCSKCAKIKRLDAMHNAPSVFNRIYTREGEWRGGYLKLMKNQDTLTKRKLIKLLALAEYFGRDLEEWIKENEHTRELMNEIEKERDNWTKTKEYQGSIKWDLFHYTMMREGSPFKLGCQCQKCIDRYTSQNIKLKNKGEGHSEREVATPPNLNAPLLSK